jgi:glc operon protein GlcG
MTLVRAVQTELEASQRGAAVAVVDAHGELLAFLRTDGCRLPSIDIAINKAYTAAREQRESKALGEASKQEGFPLTNFGNLRYVSWGGGIPIWRNGEVVGGIGVSGLPEQEDIDLARNALKHVEQL